MLELYQTSKICRGGVSLLVGIQEELERLHAVGLLEGLLADRTTGGNILWATDAYQELGEGYRRPSRASTPG